MTPSTCNVLRLRAPGGTLLLALALTLALVGCGPGVGGTGTGSSSSASTLAGFGASPAPLCGSALTEVLRCPEPPSPSAEVETLPVWLSDAVPAVRAQGLVFGNQIELLLRCDGLQFTGRWGRVAPEPGGRFYGQALATSGLGQAATLDLEPGPDGLQATLRQQDGGLLAAPVLLRTREGPVPAGTCP
jgi:hypothetical protein